jgi:hypothetical protein
LGRELCVSEEQSSDTGNDCNLHGPLPEITYRPFEFSDVRGIRQIFIDYWRDVNSIDLTGTKDIDVNGSIQTVLKVDDKVLILHRDGISIQMAILNGTDIIGVLLHRIAFDCVMAIDGMYVYEAFRKYGIGKSLINSSEKPIKKIIFQTRILKRPSLMFGGLKHMKIEPRKIFYKDKKVTWEADWR